MFSMGRERVPKDSSLWDKELSRFRSYGKIVSGNQVKTGSSGGAGLARLNGGWP
jgi:hypothetical protein